MTQFKTFCFFCKHIINPKANFRTVKFKSKSAKICMQCNASKYKVLEQKYKKFQIDCSCCGHKVMNRNCTACQNCNHFVHNTCSGLNNKDVACIEKKQISWFCPPCNESIFPLGLIESTPQGSTCTNKTNTKHTVNQCFTCLAPIPKHIYNNKNALYNKNPVQFCHLCSIKGKHIPVKDKSLLEFIGCTVCYKDVLYESIFCSICLHWSHASCNNLKKNDLYVMSSNNYGDWICHDCIASILPCINTPYNTIDNTDLMINNNINNNNHDDFVTFDECTNCYKIVKSNKSVCCSICRHWVHQRCIGSFKTSKYINELTSFLKFYKDKDWFCYSCSQTIFPFLTLTDYDYNLIMLENTLTTTLSTTEIQESCITLDELNLFENSYTHSTNNIHEDYLDDTDEIFQHPKDNCKYIVDLNNINENTNNKCCSILNFNIRSLKKNFNNFCTNIANTNTRLDIITLTETWLDSSNNLKDFEIEGYHTPIIQNRENKIGGGVLIYFHKSISHFRIRKDLCFKSQHNNCLTVEYTLNKERRLIIVCYRSPAYDNNISEFNQNLHKVIEKCNIKTTITGDFNFNLLNYENHKETSDYYDLLTSNSFKLLITKPTRITNNTVSIIDHIWSNDLANNCISSYILITDITDHLPCITVEISQSKNNGYRHYFYRCITDKNRENFVKRITKNKNALAFHTTNNMTDTQTKYADYFAHITRIYDEEFPVKKKKIHVKTLNKPWINSDLMKQIKKKNTLFSKKMKSKNPSCAQKYKECKKDLSDKLKQAKENYYHRKLYNENSTIKQKWDSLRTLIQRKKQSADFCPISDETLGNHYSTVAKKLFQNMDAINRDDIPHSSTKNNPYHNIRKQNKTFKTFEFNEISEREIYEEILKLDQNKGPGFDNLDIKSMKSIANIISPHLCTLFNSSIQHSEYPDIFKIAKCVPIFKGNHLDPYQPVNYRPISILNCLNKTLEKLLHDQIYKYLETNNIIPEFQYGYRKNRSTNQAVLKLNDIIETNKLNNTVSIAIFMDLSKAFDTVDKDILSNKLNNIGFSTNSNNLIYDYMSKRRFCMKNNSSEIYPLDYGVPQGSILGPLLFITYIHDMDSFCEHIEKIVYADDTTVIVTGRNIREAKEHANDILNQFYSYFTFNKLTVNESKTKYIVYDFRPNKEKRKETDTNEIYMNGTALEEIEKIRFLGVIFNNKLKWNDHKIHVKGKITKAIGILYNTRNVLKHSHLTNLYNTFIQPYFSYCISLWGSTVKSDTDILVKLQNKIMRILFSCKRTKDAWDSSLTTNPIVPIYQLYLLDIAKLCYQHHTILLPNSIQSIMPDILNDNLTERKTRSKTNHNYMYNNKIKKTLPKECVNLWNTIPTEIKDIAYNTTSNRKQFTAVIKSYLITKYKTLY